MRRSRIQPEFRTQKMFVAWRWWDKNGPAKRLHAFDLCGEARTYSSMEDGIQCVIPNRQKGNKILCVSIHIRFSVERAVKLPCRIKCLLLIRNAPW